MEEITVKTVTSGYDIQAHVLGSVTPLHNRTTVGTALNPTKANSFGESYCQGQKEAC